MHIELGAKNHTWENCVFCKAHAAQQEAAKAKGKKKTPPSMESHVADVAMEEDSHPKTVRWGPDPVLMQDAATQVAAEGKHYHATDCCNMQCCETTHSFVHHLDSSFDVQGKSTDQNAL